MNANKTIKRYIMEIYGKKYMGIWEKVTIEILLDTWLVA